MNETHRVAFLQKFYELTPGELNAHCKAWDDVGKPIGLDEKTVRQAVQYWEDLQVIE